MGTYSTSLDVTSALAAPRVCPACGSAELLPFSRENGVAFTCQSCQRCWTLELGLMAPVAPERPLACSQDQAGPTHTRDQEQRDTS